MIWSLKTVSPIYVWLSAKENSQDPSFELEISKSNKKFKYLLSILTQVGKRNTEIRQCIGIGKRCLRKPEQIIKIKEKKLSLETNQRQIN